MQFPEFFGFAVQLGEGAFFGNIVYAGSDIVPQDPRQYEGLDKHGVQDGPEDHADDRGRILWPA